MVNNSTKSINRITIINIVSTVLLHGISFFTTPVISALLGTDSYGIVSVYDTWLNVMTTVFSLQTLSTIAVARTKFDERKQESYQSSILFLSICSFVFLSCVVLFLLDPISNLLKLDKVVVFFMILNGFGTIGVSFLNIKFTYEFKANLNLIVSLIIVVLKLSVIFVLIRRIPESVNYYSYIMGSMFSSLSVGLVAIALVFFKGRKLFDKTYWKFCLSLALPYVFHAVSTIVLSHSDKVMIQQMMNNSEAGIYSLAIGFAGIMGIIWNALNNSWVPFFYEFARTKDRNSIINHAGQYNELYFVLSFGFLLLYPEVFRIYASDEFISGMIYIPLFVLSYYFVFIYSLIINYEIYMQNTKVIAVFTVVSALVNIALNYILIPIWGGLGAIIATVASRFVQLIAHHVAARYFIVKEEYPFRMLHYVPFVLILICMCIYYALCGYSFTIIRWGMGVCLGVFELMRIIKRRAIF